MYDVGFAYVYVCIVSYDVYNFYGHVQRRSYKSEAHFYRSWPDPTRQCFCTAKPDPKFFHLWVDPTRILHQEVQRTIMTRVKQKKKITWTSRFLPGCRDAWRILGHSKHVFSDLEWVRGASSTQYVLLTRVYLARPDLTRNPFAFTWVELARPNQTNTTPRFHLTWPGLLFTWLFWHELKIFPIR